MISILFISTLVSGSLWVSLGEEPHKAIKWIMALVSSLVPFLKGWSEHRAFPTHIKDHEDAAKKYRKLAFNIDLKLRLLSLDVRDFRRTLATMLDIEQSAPLETSMPEYDPERYIMKLEREKMITLDKTQKKEVCELSPMRHLHTPPFPHPPSTLSPNITANSIKRRRVFQAPTSAMISANPVELGSIRIDAATLRNAKDDDDMSVTSIENRAVYGMRKS